MCVPKETCSKAKITEGLDESVVVESVNNVFYVNDTHWEPIDYSWVSYACSSFDGLMIGKPQRMCLQGKWSNFMPRCTRGKCFNYNHLIIRVMFNEKTIVKP